MNVEDPATTAFPFIAQLSVDARRDLLRDARVLNPPRNSLLLKRGDRIDGAYLVLDGELNVHTISLAGREATLYRVHSGESCIFALNSLFTNVLYPAWVRVSSRTQILRLNGNALKRLFERESAVRQWTIGVQSQRIFDLVSTLEQVQTLSVQERLRSHLIRSADQDLCVRRTHESIANSLGTTREVVTRHLKQFVKDGLLSLSRGCVQILSVEKLQAGAQV